MPSSEIQISVTTTNTRRRPQRSGQDANAHKVAHICNVMYFFAAKLCINHSLKRRFHVYFQSRLLLCNETELLAMVVTRLTRISVCSLIWKMCICVR